MDWFIGLNVQLSEAKQGCSRVVSRPADRVRNIFQKPRADRVGGCGSGGVRDPTRRNRGWSGQKGFQISRVESGQPAPIRSLNSDPTLEKS